MLCDITSPYVYTDLLIGVLRCLCSRQVSIAVSVATELIFLLLLLLLLRLVLLDGRVDRWSRRGPRCRCLKAATAGHLFAAGVPYRIVHRAVEVAQLLTRVHVRARFRHRAVAAVHQIKTHTGAIWRTRSYRSACVLRCGFSLSIL